MSEEKKFKKVFKYELYLRLMLNDEMELPEDVEIFPTGNMDESGGRAIVTDKFYKDIKNYLNHIHNIHDLIEIARARKCFISEINKEEKIVRERISRLKEDKRYEVIEALNTIRGCINEIFLDDEDTYDD